MNLSERLAKAAMERGRHPGSSAQRMRPATESAPRADASPDLESTKAALPARTDDPVDAGRVAVMKMRLPEPTSRAEIESESSLPLWQRPVADVLRDAGLATVTTLPIVPRDDVSDDDLDGAELAETIPMPGMWRPPTSVAIDPDALYVPPLAAAEAAGLASATLRAEQTDYHAHLDDMDVIDLDDLPVDAEIVDGPSADALLERWTEDVSADEYHRQEKVDGLLRLMLDTPQQPRITFGPIDLRDEIQLPDEVLPRADDEHTCPACGARASVDIHDPMRGRVHLSCNSCFKMWQQRVAPTAHSDEPLMRD